MRKTKETDADRFIFEMYDHLAVCNECGEYFFCNECVKLILRDYPNTLIMFPCSSEYPS
jgi:hypothetical protein